MADYRKRVDPPAQYKNMLGDRSKKPLSVQMAEVGVEFTPAGTIFGLNDIKEELQKENPDYYKVGMMGGLEVLGLIPGLDKLAVDAIKAGARKTGLNKVADQTDALLGKPKAEDSVKTEIIAGPGAKSYSDASLLRAGRLEAAGASPAQIEAETGRIKTGTPEDYLDNKGKTLADISPEYKNLVGIRDHLQGLIKQISTENSSSAASEIARYERELAEINSKIVKFEKANPADEAGIVVKPQNPFKFEIDDSQIEIRNNDGSQTLSEATKHYPIIIRNIIPDHTELFREYPDLENVEFYVDSSATYAHFDPTISRNGAIVVNPKLKEKLVNPNNKSFRDTFFHELQHAAQFQDFKIAGLQQLGGSPTGFGELVAAYPNSKKYESVVKNKKLVGLKNEILDIFEKQKGTGALDQKLTSGLPGQIPNPSEVFGDVKVAKQIARKMRELEAELFKKYMSTASEVEARVVGLRAQKLGEPSTNKIVSDISDQRNIETKEEYTKNKSESPLGKKKAQAVLKLGSMTDEEILRYAQGAINFSRYAKGIDTELMGFDSMGPVRGNYAKGGLSMLPAVDDDRTPSRPRDTFNPLAFAKESWESAKENFRNAGVTEVDLDDPTLYNGYIRAVDYLKDSGLAGLDLIDAAAKAVIGTAGELVTRSDASQKRFQRDIYSMPEAFAGAAGARSVTQLDDALEAGAESARLAKAASGPLAADAVGQTRALLSGDTEFLRGTPTDRATTQPAGAQVPGMFDRKTPEEMQDYQKSVFDPSPDKDNPAKLMQELQDDINMSVYDFGIGSDGFLDTAFTPVKIRHGSQVNMRVPIERYLRDTGLYGRISEVAKEVPAKNYVPASIVLDDFNEMVAEDILTWYNEMLPHMLADASPEKIFRLAAHLNMYPGVDWRRQENRSLIEDLAEEIYDEMDTSNLSELKITNPRTVLPDSVKNSEKLKITRVGNDDTGSLVVRPIKPDSNDKYEFYDILGDGADEFKASLKPYLAEGIIDFLENNFERYIPETLENPNTGTSTTRENLLRGVRQEWEGGPNFDLEPIDTLKEIKFKSLGKELLENFKSRVANKEFVTGAEILKVLQNDPRMNPKTIPNWMKTNEYKNKKIPVADLQGTIDYYSATSPQVSLKNKRQYTGYQRQFGEGFVGGEFKDYIEIVPSTSENQMLFSDVYSHYGPRALSHTRATVLNKSDATWKPREAKILGDDDYMMVEELQSDLVQQGSQNKKNIENSPIKKSQEALELNLQSLIAEASKRGITKIVIPPFSKIASARLMGERLDLALKNKSRSRKTGEIVDGNLFHRIYVTELNKALDKFEKSYPITVHKNVELPYQPRPGSTSTVDADELDEFFNLPDDDEIFDAGPDDAQQALVDAELNNPNVTENDIITEDEMLNDIAEMMDEDGNIVDAITNQILREYEEPKPEFIGGGYILDISQMDKEFKLQEPKFAEGGVVGNMNRQMELFARGGLRDDGMDMDPVSGNEVPSGSLAEEVRDDIPAQLSEGEYVVPADVVRYYGVKFFEDLRAEAKMGLTRMEADGRIGGEPVEDDLSPQEMALLQEVMAAEQPIGMNEGGLAPYKNEDYIFSPTLPNPALSVPGMSYMTPTTPQPFVQQPVPTTTTPTPSVEYCESINMMYDPETKMCVPKPTVQQESDGDSTPTPTGDGKPAFQDWGEELNFSDFESMEAWAKSLGEPMKGEKLIKGAGLLMGGPGAILAGGVTAGDALKDISDLRAAAIVAKARGDDKTAEMLEGYVEDRIKASSGIVDILDDLVATGTQKADAYAKRYGFDNIEDVLSSEENKKLFSGFTRSEMAEQRRATKRFRPRVSSPGLSGSTPESEDEVGKEQTVMQQTASSKSASDGGGSGSLVTGSYTGGNDDNNNSSLESQIEQEVKDYAASGKKFDMNDPSTWANKGGLMRKPKKSKK